MCSDQPRTYFINTFQGLIVTELKVMVKWYLKRVTAQNKNNIPYTSTSH